MGVSSNERYAKKKKKREREGKRERGKESNKKEKRKIIVEVTMNRKGLSMVAIRW